MSRLNTYWTSDGENAGDGTIKPRRSGRILSTRWWRKRQGPERRCKVRTLDEMIRELVCERFITEEPYAKWTKDDMEDELLEFSRWLYKQFLESQKGGAK